MAVAATKERRELLVKIAHLYYEQKLSQQQIADQLFMSRSNVSMLLKACEECGIVKISIVEPEDPKALDIAEGIRNDFFMRDVLIAASSSDINSTRDSVGALTANYLAKHLKNGMKMGFTLGKTNLCILPNLTFPDYIKADTVALTGSLASKYTKSDNSELLRQYKEKLEGEAYNIAAPMMVKSKTLKQLLLQEPLIKNAFQQMEQLDIVLLNIGNARFPHRMAIHEGQLSSADVLQLIELKAVAVICGRYFDANGEPCNAGINDRIIAIDLDTLKNVPLRIGVAVGTESAAAAKSILRSGYINTLIIDESLARCL